MIAKLASLLEETYEDKLDPYSLRKKARGKKRRAKTRVPDSSTAKRNHGLRVHNTRLNYSKGLSRAIDGPRPSNGGKTEAEKARGLSSTPLPAKAILDAGKLVPFGCGQKRFSDEGGRKTTGGEK